MAAAVYACRAPGGDATGVRVGDSIGLAADQGPVVLHIDGVSADPERDFTPVAEVALRGV